MAQSAGELEIRMFAEMARLRKDMNDALGIVNKATKGIEDAASQAKKALGALGIGVSAIGFVNLIKGSIDAMDKLNDLSKSTGITVETLAGLRVLAAQSGTDLDGLAKGINKMSVEMGKSPAAFRALGITAKDSLGAFKQLADLFNSLTDINLRNALAMKIFSRSWAEMAPVLAEGGKRIGEIVEQGTKFSGITKEMTLQADELNDKWALLGGTSGFLTRMVAPMLPLLNTIADEMLKSAENALETKSAFNILTEAVRTLTILGSDFAFVWQQIGIAMVGVKEQLKGFASGGIAGFTEARDMMKKILDQNRAALDEFQKKVMQAGKGPQTLIQAPEVPVTDPDKEAAANAFVREAELKAIAAKAAAEKKAALERQKDLFSLIDAADELFEKDRQNTIELMKLHHKAALERSTDLSQLIAEADAGFEAERQATFEKNEKNKRRDFPKQFGDVDQARLDAVRESLMTEDELRKFSYQRDRDALNDTLGKKWEMQQQYAELYGKLIRKNALNELLIERQKNEAVRAQQVSTWQSGAELLQQFAGESKAAAIAVIAINKALAIAQVMMNIPVAQARALAELGPVAGAAAAATIGAWGAVQIGLIAATGLAQAFNVGSGGAELGSPANPVSTQPGAGATAAPVGNGTTTVINLNGETFSRKQVKELLEKVTENTRDGGRVVLAD
jgi:hypothetical protein